MTLSIVPSFALIVSIDVAWWDVENGHFLYLLSIAINAVTVYGATVFAYVLSYFQPT
jgi:hypothetical protein